MGPHPALEELVMGKIDTQVPHGLPRAGNPWELGGSLPLSSLEIYY